MIGISSPLRPGVLHTLPLSTLATLAFLVFLEQDRHTAVLVPSLAVPLPGMVFVCKTPKSSPSGLSQCPFSMWLFLTSLLSPRPPYTGLPNLSYFVLFFSVSKSSSNILQDVLFTTFIIYYRSLLPSLPHSILLVVNSKKCGDICWFFMMHSQSKHNIWITVGAQSMFVESMS